jgi:hypothetical protein
MAGFLNRISTARSGEYKYSYWDTAWLGPPSADDLKPYKVLVIFSGTASVFYDRYTRSAFASYIAMTGKRALVTGQDEGFALNEVLRPKADAWYNTYSKPCTSTTPGPTTPTRAGASSLCRVRAATR